MRKERQKWKQRKLGKTAAKPTLFKAFVNEQKNFVSVANELDCTASDFQSLQLEEIGSE